MTGSLPERSRVRIPGGWASLLSGHRPSERLVSAVLLALCTVAMFVAEGSPRWLWHASSESLRRAVAEAPVTARQLSVQLLDDAPPGTTTDPLQLQQRRLDRVTDELPARFVGRFVDRRLVVDTQRFSVSTLFGDDGSGAPPSLPTLVTFRTHPELDDHSRLVAGRIARPTRRTEAGLPVFEFELTPAAAAEVGWEVGRVVVLTLDPSDPVTRAANRSIPEDFAAQLVGLRELTPESDPYWFGDARLHRPTVSDTNLGADVFLHAMVHPDQLPTRPFLVDQRSVFAIEQRLDLDPAAVTLDESDRILGEIANIEARFADQPTSTRPGVRTGLGPVLEAERSQRSAARQLLLVAGVPALGVVAGLVLVILVLVADRRATRSAVALTRGASTGQVMTAAAVETAAVVLTAYAIGRILAEWFVAAPVGGARSAIAIGGALVVGSVGVAAASAGRFGRGVEKAVAAASLLSVVVAVAAWVTLRRRGVIQGRDDIDVLVVAVPLLVAVAVASVARRLAPWTAVGLTRLRTDPGVGVLVGLRRVASARSSSFGLVVLTVVSFTVVSIGQAMDDALVQGAADASWIEVGAPFRLDGRPPDPAATLAGLDGAVVATSGSRRIGVRFDDVAATVTVTALDVDASTRLTAGTSADLEWPAALTASTAPTSGVDTSGAVPAVASLRIGGRTVAVGDRLTGIGGGAELVLEVVEVRPSLSGRTRDALVVDRSVLEARGGAVTTFDTVRIGVDRMADGWSEDGAVTALDDLRAQVQGVAADSGLRFAARSDVMASRYGDPLSGAIVTAFRIGSVIAASAAVAGLIAIGLVTARARRREVALLDLLGAPRRVIAAAVLAELIVPLFVGVGAGVASGWLVTSAFDGRVDLSGFTGGQSPPIRWDPASLALRVSLFLVVACVVAGLVARRIAGSGTGDLVRFGEGG